MSVIWDLSITVSDITLILNAVQEGDPKAAEELLPLVYEELRRLAAAKMAEQPGQTLQPTAFYAASKQAMRGADFDAHGSFGCVCPEGGVYWAQSVHAAWIRPPART